MSFWMAMLGLLFLSLMTLLVFSLRVNNEQDSKPKYFWGAAALVGVVSLLMYQQLGSEGELSLQAKMASLAEGVASNPDASRAKVVELVREFELATQNYPEKPEYWYLLGTQQTALERYSEAAYSYERAYELAPGDISLLARQTEAEFIAAQYSLTEPVTQLIDQVLAKAPNNPTIMGILGITAYRGGQFDTAITFWQRALTSLPANSAEANAMRATIAQAQAQIQPNAEAQTAEAAGTSEVTQGTAAPAEQPDTSSGFRVNVALAEGLAVPPNTTLFVFVRQAGGPPMPIVVERTTVGALPTQFLMDDSKVMIQGQSLANFPSLEVVARVSLSGQPSAQPGDYEAIHGPIVLDEVDGPINLTIADQVP